jgi:threonine dehydrogenase-like Zn-dependent dehydrogenase
VRGVRNTPDGIAVVDTQPDTEGRVRVVVDSCGICGSDVHVAAFGPTRYTLGHEVSGRLDDGTPVAVLPSVSCGTCDRCRADQPQQCPSALGAMYGLTLDGGMAEEIWVDPANAVPLPDGLPVGQACLVEPVSVAVHGCNRAGVASGTRVLVIGAGPIGLAAIAAARSIGAEVDLLANRPRRVEAGERLGATVATGSGYDIVLDAAGTQGAMDSAIDLARPGGTVGILGTYWDPVSVGMALQMKEVTLVPAFTSGHHHGGREFVDAAQVVADTPELFDAMVTHHFDLDDAAEAFRIAGDRSADAIKVVLHP